MGILASVGAAYLEGRQVKALHLFKFDWNDGGAAPKHFFLGEGKITADSEIWYGMGQLVSVSDIQVGMRGEAPKTTFTVSGVDPLLLNATVLSADAVYNRPCYAYYQYYDADDPGWAPLDDPLLYWTATMRSIAFSEEGEQRSIALEAEGPYFRRSRPVYGNFSDRDQQARYAGDRGCEQMPLLVDTTIQWPYHNLT